MSNVKAGHWGPTMMARYAIENLGVHADEDSLRKGIARKLQKLGIANKSGQLIFPEARAKRLLAVELEGYIRRLREKTKEEAEREREASEFVRSIPGLPSEYSDKRPLELADEFLASPFSDSQRGNDPGITSMELNQAELLFLFRYLLEKDGMEFDRASFRKDYREIANVNRDLRSLIRKKEHGEAVGNDDIEDKRFLETQLRDKLKTCSAYIHRIEVAQEASEDDK